MSTLAERREAIVEILKEWDDPVMGPPPHIAYLGVADRILALEDEGAQEPVAHAVMADGFVMTADRNTALLEDDRARLVENFPNKTFAPGLVPLYTRPPSEEETP